MELMTDTCHCDTSIPGAHRHPSTASDSLHLSFGGWAVVPIETTSLHVVSFCHENEESYLVAYLEENVAFPSLPNL
jgi:hypothetical protein